MKNIFFMVAAVTGLILASCGSKGPAYDIKMKGKKGDTYTMVITSTTDMEAMGTSSRQNFTFYGATEIMDVTGEGNIISKQKITRAIIDQDLPGLGAVSFDTDDTASAAGMDQMSAAVYEVFRDILNKEMIVEMKPNGEMTHMEMDGSINEIIRKSVESNLQNNTLSLPEKPVKIGDTWKGEKEMENNGMKMKIAMTYRLKEVKDNLAEIAAKGKITSGGGPMDMEGTMQGTIYFDLDRGQLMKSDLTQDATVSVSSMEMKLKTDIKIEVK